MKKLNLKILFKRAWLLTLVMLVSGAAAFVFAQLQAPSYQAKTQLMVGPGIDSPNPDLNVLRAGGQLIQTYAELPLTAPFLQGIIDQLGLDIEPDELAQSIDIRPNQETQILTVQVQHGNAKQAQMIAMAIADQLVKVSPSNPESSAAKIKAQIRSQVVELEKMVADMKQTIQQQESDYQKTVELEQASAEGAGSNQAVAEQLKTLEQNNELIGDAATQREAGILILEELVINTDARILQFEDELKRDTNTATQKLIMDQIRQEQTHLSQLQQAIAEVKRPVEGQPLDGYILAAQAELQTLEQDLDKTFNYDFRRLQIDRITQQQEKLNLARAIESDRQKLILEQIAQERDRISQVELARIEKKRMILEQISLERSRLTETQNTLALLYNSLQAADPNLVKIIEPASSATPVTTPLALTTLIGALAGLMLSVVGVLAIEAYNDSISTDEQVTDIYPVPVIDIDGDSALSNGLFRKKDGWWERIQKYQMLGIRLLYTEKAAPTKIIMVSAADASEAAGNTAANLAISLSQSGKRVILIDADGSQPTISSLFGLINREGLSDYLSGSGMRSLSLVSIEGYASLAVWPYGNARIDPASLTSGRMISQLERFKERADIVLCSIPQIQRPDSLMLASHANGIILVIHKGITTQRTLANIKMNLELVGAKVLAAVLESGRAAMRGFDWRIETRVNRAGSAQAKMLSEKSSNSQNDADNGVVGSSVSS